MVDNIPSILPRDSISKYDFNNAVVDSTYVDIKFTSPGFGNRYIPEFVPIQENIDTIPSMTKLMGNIKSVRYRVNIPFTKNAYKIEDNYGVNSKGATNAEICLAKYATAVAQDAESLGACYTGVKYSLLNAGIIDDYGDMPKGKAVDSIPYFENNPDKFKAVECSADDLKNLPAGHIIVYYKDGLSGHIAITNGNGQEMSDSTDNMGWLEQKGEGANFKVFKLTDNWQYNSDTRKLVFNANEPTA